MRHYIIFLFSILTLTISNSQNWYTTGGNNQKNGISEIKGPDAANALWTVNSTNSTAWGNSVYTFGDKFVTARVILSPYTGKVECRNLQTGALLWEFIPNASARMYCVGFTEDAVYAHDYNTNILYSLYPESGNVKWTASNSIIFPGNTGLVFDCSGNPIDYKRKLNKLSGTVMWSNNYIIPVGPDGGFVTFGNTYYHWTGSIVTPKQLIAIDMTTGSTKYLSQSLPGDGDQENDLVCGPDGTIYIARDGGDLWAFTDNGSAFVEKWHRAPGVLPIAAGNGVLYCANLGTNRAMRVNITNGQTIDSASLLIAARYISIGSDSTVYICTGEVSGRYVAMTPDLQTIKWQVNVSYNYYSGPALAKDGILVTVGSGTEIKAYKTNAVIKPVADIRYSPVPATIGTPINFYDQSSFNPTSWLWLFPGSNTPVSTQQNPVNIIYTIPGTYTVTLAATNSNGTDTIIKPCFQVILMEEISKNDEKILSDYKLEQNYPNPFNPVTKINFSIPLNYTGEKVSLIIYNSIGQEVKILVNESMSTGNYEVIFDGSDFTSGVYFYSLLINGYRTDTKRMLLIK